jgi:predicted ferric reductase
MAWFWVAVYLALVLAPLGVLLVGGTPAKGGFWWDVAIACGFAGLAMMAAQFVLTARLRTAAAPFGIDVIYYFHRYVAYVLFAVVLVHAVLILALDPAQLWLARLPPTPAILAGIVSFSLLLLLVGSSAWRKRLRIPYDAWRRAHLVLAIAAVSFGFAHMRVIDYYSSAPAVGVLWALIAVGLIAIVAWVRVIRPAVLLRSRYRIADLRAELGDAWTLTLAPDGHGGFAFAPGQFAWFSLGHSPFTMREHPFSFAGPPRPGGELEITVKAIGDFTRTIGQLAPGTRAYVDGPYGSFSIDRYPAAAGYVFIAGGIGVAPMLGMLSALADRGDTRRHLLLTAHSRWDRIPRRDEIAALEERLDLGVVHALEEPPADWPGERGWITRELLDRYLPPARERCEYFICGPRAMAQAMERFLHDLGIPPSRVHTELFEMA